MRYAIALIATLLVGDCSLGALNGTDSADDVVSLRPSWVFTQLREKGVESALISHCGGKLYSCREARERLILTAEECSNVFLGIIDGNKYADVPRDLYEISYPGLVLFVKPVGEQYLLRINLNASATPSNIAVVLCPQESLVIKKALQDFLESN